MPLVENEEFKRTSVPKDRNDDDEVFYCSLTHEVFTDYKSFADRMLQCNSMVWECSFTGKSNMTYSEALRCENAAKKSLKSFPLGVRAPLLYLATKTKRTKFNDVHTDVFTFAKDRYFKGEVVETCLASDNKWKESQIVEVIAPTEEKLEQAGIKKRDTTVNDRNFFPPASFYTYKVEYVDTKDSDISEIMTVDHTQIKRKIRLFGREKCRLFLRYHMEQTAANGYWTVKKSSEDDFHLADLTFSQFFAGPEPKFFSAKPVVKKMRQESLHKFLKRNGDLPAKSPVDKKSVDNNNSATEKADDNEKKEKVKKKEPKPIIVMDPAERLRKKKEESVLHANYLREWRKLREDLELEDQQKPPALPPVKTDIPDRYVGDALAIVEFIESFSDSLSLKKFFPYGFSFDLVQRALMTQEVAGPLADIVMMLLSDLFKYQKMEEEDNEDGDAKLPDENDLVDSEDLRNGQIKIEQATKLAAVAAQWAVRHHGLPINKMNLSPLTCTEVLRLHLLSSGGKEIDDTAEKLRGGYVNEEDPGLYFRLHQPHILKSLAIHHVSELPVGDKTKLITCLMDQLLTFAEFRNIAESRRDKSRLDKLDLRAMQLVEKKRDEEHRTAKFKLKKEGKNNPDLEKQLKQLDADMEPKKSENDKKIEDLMKIAYSHQIHMGQDRAFRRYLHLESIPGVFVNFEEENPGTCYAEIPKYHPELFNAKDSTIIAHIKKMVPPPPPPVKQEQETNNSSDKENSPSKKNCNNSVSNQQTVPAVKINGVRASITNDSVLGNNEQDAEAQQRMSRDLMMCSADPRNCIVHSTGIERTRWSFIPNKEVLSECIETLNKRGIRESELLMNLKCNRKVLEHSICGTPLETMNFKVPEVKQPQENEEEIVEKRTTRQQSNNKISIENDHKNYDEFYKTANLGFPKDMTIENVLHKFLVDKLLELELKMTQKIKIPLPFDREAWRKSLQDRDYENFDKTIVRDSLISDIMNTDDCSTIPAQDSSTQGEKLERDPGVFLGPTLDCSLNESAMNTNDILLSQTEDTHEALKCLSIALFQLACALGVTNLRKPLGYFGIKSKQVMETRFKQWENSLLSSTSFSQIYLHYLELNSCINWSRECSGITCKICKVRNITTQSAVFCDNCNSAQHRKCHPRLKRFPKSEWLCRTCVTERNEKNNMVPEQPNKRQHIFRSEQTEYKNEHQNGSVTWTDEGEEDEGIDQEDEQKRDPLEQKICKMCGSLGEVVECDQCSSCYHVECCTPPMRRAPRGPWSCSDCKTKHNTTEKRYCKNGALILQQRRTSVVDGQRRCATKALYKIHDFAKSLRQQSESEDDDEDESSEAEDMVQKRHSRRDEGRDDLPLHNAALQELLTEVMKDPNAWPFLRPVTKNEVPDYYDVITKPMDFGTIKYKLNMGEYSQDAQLMSDAVLIFQNCNTYNHTDDDVYKCGVQLLKVFEAKCQELGLQLPDEMDCYDTPRPRKKRRTK